jgi:hydrogenase-4 component E
MVSLLYCHLYDHEPKKLTSSKVILIPFFLFKVVEKIKLDREVSMYLNIANSLLFSILIVIFAFYISNKINITGEVFAKIIRNA